MSGEYNTALTAAASPCTYPYASSASSSASSSSCSVFSVDAASSQASTASSSASLDGEDSWTVYRSRARLQPACSNQSDALAFAPISRVHTFPQYQPPSAFLESTSQKILPPLRTTDLAIPLDQRQHHRRSSISSKNGAPPILVRQTDRKVNFVDRLVYSATQMVEVIWPLSVPACRTEDPSGRGVLPLRIFIEETLRRSKTSYSTLQVALYYLVLIKFHVPKHDFTMEQPQDGQCRALQCGRRMFLAALILASKYLQDRNYSARAWSKISGLKVCEINTNEMAFLQAIDWKLHIPLSLWERWQEIVFLYAPQPPPSAPGCIMRLANSWAPILPKLTPELDTIELPPRTPTHLGTPEKQSMALRSPVSIASPAASTPTPAEYPLPRFLEPKPDMLPPTPTLQRMRPLPTPVFTPQSAVSATPTLTAAAYGSRRPSMCSVMAQVQGASLARCAMEWNPAFKGVDGNLPTRRPSLAPSTASSSSSPESMVSDSSSRSSRASSISSVSSVNWAPNQPTCLARLATCRSARLPYPGTLPKTQETSLEAMVADSLSPTLENLYLDEETPTPLPLRQRPIETNQVIPSTPTQNDCVGSGCSDDPRRSRKRGRSSVDISLQHNVRHLLKSSRSGYFASPQTSVLPDRTLPAGLHMSSTATPGDRTPSSSMGPKALQSPRRPATDRRLPVQKDFGKKRTCCASEASALLGRQGVGMWEGVL